MIAEVDTWSNEWRGNFMFHLGHLSVMFAVPFIIAASVSLVSVLKGDEV